jgi:hypothetical protein
MLLFIGPCVTCNCSSPVEEKQFRSPSWTYSSLSRQVHLPPGIFTAAGQVVSSSPSSAPAFHPATRHHVRNDIAPAQSAGAQCLLSGIPYAQDDQGTSPFDIPFCPPRPPPPPPQHCSIIVPFKSISSNSSSSAPATSCPEGSSKDESPARSSSASSQRLQVATLDVPH